MPDFYSPCEYLSLDATDYVPECTAPEIQELIEQIYFWINDMDSDAISQFGDLEDVLMDLRRIEEHVIKALEHHERKVNI